MSSTERGVLRGVEEDGEGLLAVFFQQKLGFERLAKDECRAAKCVDGGDESKQVAHLIIAVGVRTTVPE